MTKTEVIIKIGAELGSITIYGMRTERGWSFRRDVSDQTPELLDEEWIEHSSATVDTWEGALKLLDKYPWFKLHPIQIHPDFRQQIWLAVQARLANAEISEFALQRWRELCACAVTGQGADEVHAAEPGLTQPPEAQGKSTPKPRLTMTNFNSFLEEYQSAWRRDNISNQEHGLYKGVRHPWILPHSAWKEGLWCGIRESLPAYIDENKIAKHKDAHNLKSSWTLCANLYFSFREDHGRRLLAGFLRNKVSANIRDVERVELEYVEDSPLDPQSLFGESYSGKRGQSDLTRCRFPRED
jgi:hypothetical protein